MKTFIRVSYIIIGVIIAFSVLSCSKSSNSGEKQTLTIAAVPTELNALIYIAEKMKFFTDNDLDVILKNYDSGASAAAGMLNGETDIALAAEFPIVRHVLDKEDILNFGTITKYENTYIIWWAGRGINTIMDLKDKRIGVTLTTISEFYLGRMLELNGINIQQVTLVDTKAADAENALINGEVDAVVTWEPWASQIEQHQAERVIMRAAQSDQYAYWNLVSTTGWVGNHADIIEGLLKSLVRAEVFIYDHQDEAKTIVRKRMDFNKAYLETIWPHYQFSVSLGQSLIVAMEDEARWMISNNLTVEKQVPDFTGYIYEDILKEIKPEAVNIIR
jgi:NitT/TauT family transport system substrate-binding protein